ncbi:WYL domain-containing protein [Azoarcus sp. CIB]|uniref:helix-turn-helix transcriptional regulator n=1 Tax=Aromatoleum sp. (strain CIB) TaxID=198107 RepID=UPI00067D7EB1|nr:WYL domain-containing protein [Azoarcus sp. CIB]
MAVAYETRIKRLKAIENLLPVEGEQDTGLAAQILLQRLPDLYEGSDGARVRAVQRDLKDLLAEGRIVVRNPRAKPLTYFRRGTPGDDDYLDDAAWSYVVTNVEKALEEVMPERRLESALRRLQNAELGVKLSSKRFRIVPDTLRLLPADFELATLAKVLRAVVEERTLKLAYRDSEGKKTECVVHPQAALQRGPRFYFFALKNDEAEPVRMYALHRVIRAEVSSDPARIAPGFDLDAAIYRGQADFGNGRMIRLEAQVRGYVADLVQECAMGRDQQAVPEPEGSDFDIRLTVTLPSTGQLYRWLLGCGANIKVLAPVELRQAIVGQVAKVAAMYQAAA